MGTIWFFRFCEPLAPPSPEFGVTQARPFLELLAVGLANVLPTRPPAAAWLCYLADATYL